MEWELELCLKPDLRSLLRTYLEQAFLSGRTSSLEHERAVTLRGLTLARVRFFCVGWFCWLAPVLLKSTTEMQEQNEVIIALDDAATVTSQKNFPPKNFSPPGQKAVSNFLAKSYFGRVISLHMTL